MRKRQVIVGEVIPQPKMEIESTIPLPSFEGDYVMEVPSSEPFFTQRLSGEAAFAYWHDAAGHGTLMSDGDPAQGFIFLGKYAYEHPETRIHIIPFQDHVLARSEEAEADVCDPEFLERVLDGLRAVA